MLTYVDESGHDDAAYERIHWEYGERPSWWKQTRMVWLFSSADSASGFATADLEVAASNLIEAHTAVPLAVVWRELFLHAPRSLSGHTFLPTFGLRVEAERVAPFAREQLARLRELQAAVARLEPALKDLVVTNAQEVAKELGDGSGVLLFSERFPETYFGLTPAEMLVWARGTSSYELEDACRRYAEQSKQDAATARETRQRDEAEQRELRDFVERLSKSYFEPSDETEATALALHREVRMHNGNQSAINSAERERDHFIRNEILNRKAEQDRELKRREHPGQ